MKVCIDARMIMTSGIGTVIQNFIANFRNEFDLFLIGDPSKIELFLPQMSNAITIESNDKIYSIREQFNLLKKIPKCDVFWSPHYNIPLLPIRASKRIVHIHDVFHLAFSDQLSIAQKIYANLMISQAVQLSDKVVTASEFSRSEISKFIKKAEPKINVIYNGVDANFFKVIDNNHQLESIRVKYSLPKKFILYVGNVKPHKNLKRLIEAFLLAKDRLLDCHLVIVGKNEGFINGDPLLFKKISESNFLTERVRFTGYVSNADLPFVYNLANLFVFPSIYEGFGLPPLEAMACGCPVLVSYAASMPEVCGDAAQYFNPNDPNDIANKIIDALFSVNSYFIQQGLQRIESFSWKTTYKQQVSLLHQTIS